MAELNSLKMVMILFALGSVCFAQDKTSPIAIDCTFHSNLDVLKKLRFPGYSSAKVASENIVFVRPDVLPRSDRPRFQPTFGTWVKGLDTLTAPSTGARLALGCER